MTYELLVDLLLGLALVAAPFGVMALGDGLVQWWADRGPDLRARTRATWRRLTAVDDPLASAVGCPGGSVSWVPSAAHDRSAAHRDDRLHRADSRLRVRASSEIPNISVDGRAITRTYTAAPRGDDGRIGWWRLARAGVLVATVVLLLVEAEFLAAAIVGCTGLVLVALDDLTDTLAGRPRR